MSRPTPMLCLWRTTRRIRTLSSFQHNRPFRDQGYLFPSCQAPPSMTTRRILLATSCQITHPAVLLYAYDRALTAARGAINRMLLRDQESCSRSVRKFLLVVRFVPTTASTTEPCSWAPELLFVSRILSTTYNAPMVAIAKTLCRLPIWKP
ncbi:hypothetical protein BDN71DRAFT_805925 [Pleurotus eryngii]|uniref:Uncharacterized protein n=1 Tax=Pleurotus eryngii TaxID=5323 RepID=A0A9P6DH19_PLEER|nr:hypothetical protein BDN71DRAFT_805925 [Pleurotus eryngii]